MNRFTHDIILCKSTSISNILINSSKNKYKPFAFYIHKHWETSLDHCIDLAHERIPQQLSAYLFWRLAKANASLVLPNVILPFLCCLGKCKTQFSSPWFLTQTWVFLKLENQVFALKKRDSEISILW
jgi:hypothetical protein